MRRAKKEMMQPGYDGAVEFIAPVRISMTRFESQNMRARPGTFVWRYGRKTADSAVYHAGSEFAILWEKAGTAAPASPDMGSQGGGGSWKGMPDSRVVALDKLRPILAEIGTEQKIRLLAYCVEGATVSEIAIFAGVPDRDMAAVIHQDVNALAKAMRKL